MDRMPPSEGGDAGSIPARSTYKPLSLEEFCHACLAAGGSVFRHKPALCCLVDCLVSRGKGRLVALLCRASRFKNTPEVILAHIIKSLPAEALAVCFLGRLCYCHTSRILTDRAQSSKFQV